MNYKNIYNNIINKPKIITKGYFEKHHIIPRCLGGADNKSNIVKLTYREHFLCHWLLCKIYPENFKLKAAFSKMLECTSHKQRVITSRQFEAVKRVLKDTRYPWLDNLEPWNKGKKGVQVAWNKGKKTGNATEERKKKCSETLKKFYKNNVHNRSGKDPWNKGKKGVQVAWNKGVPAIKIQCIYCKKESNYLNIKRWHNENCKSKELLAA